MTVKQIVAMKRVIDLSEDLDYLLTVYLERHPEASLSELINKGIRLILEQDPGSPRQMGSAKQKLKILSEDEDYLKDFIEYL
ncbi:MAG: hypothetical protein ACFCU9_03620 [Cyanophyceae cyanobacterium]